MYKTKTKRKIWQHKFHIAPSSDPKLNKHQSFGRTGFCAAPKPQFIFLKLCIVDFLKQPLILKKVEKNPKRSGQLQHPSKGLL